MTGESIRKFFRDLFGSKLVSRLEEDLLRLRQDFEERMRDKDVVIAELRQEKAVLWQKVTLLELSVMPRSSKQGAEYVQYARPTKPEFAVKGAPFEAAPMMTAWQKIQVEHDQQIAKELEEEAKVSKG